MDVEAIKRQAKSNLGWRPGAPRSEIRAYQQVIKLCDEVIRLRAFEKTVNVIMLAANGPVRVALLKALEADRAG
jgi:hypothetical protein